MEWKPEVLATGLEFPEGPIAMGDGEVVFTQIRGQRLSRYKGGKVETIAVTGGGANGATLGPDGAFYVANNGGLTSGPEGQWHADPLINGSIQRVTPSGELSELAIDLPGEKPQRPNDLCFGPDGKLYFTDPHNWEDLAHLKPGRVDRTDMDGNVEQLAELKAFPNGIGFGPDDRLYVAESGTQHIWVYDWSESGLGEPEAFCVIPKGYPDGFCFDADGNLIICGSMGDQITFYDRSGKLIDQIETPEHSEPTNCCIGDGKLYVTCSGSGELVALDYSVAALPLYPQRA